MIFQNMTMDELIAEGRDSTNQLLHEICNRLSGRLVGTIEAADNATVAGRTVRAIKEYGDMVLLIFTDGAYFVIDGEEQDGAVEFTMGRTLLRSERYRYGLMTPAEAQIYRDEQRAQETERKAKRLEALRKELAELEGSGK